MNDVPIEIQIATLVIAGIAAAGAVAAVIVALAARRDSKRSADAAQTAATAAQQSASAAQTTETENEGEINPESLDLILELTKGGPESQLRDVDALDAKTVQVFAAASIVIGLATLVGDRGGTASTVLLLLALGSFAVSVGAAAVGLFVRDFRKSYQADYLWGHFWDRPAQELKHSVVADIAAAYSHNKTVIETKARAAQVAVIMTGLEALLVGLALVVARLD